MSKAPQDTMPAEVLDVVNLHRRFRLPRQSLLRPANEVYALNGVSFQVARGECLAIVGESGCGKSTLARLVMGLDQADAGHVKILGQELGAMTAAALRRHRRHFQIVFQDPFASLDPRRTVAWSVAEPLHALGEKRPPAQAQEAVRNVLHDVGLRPQDMDKYPHEFSGGQRQRIALARALITRPDLIVADEPVSALDVSVQAQVLNLMLDLKQEYGVAYLFISHDLGVVDYIADRIAVMYLGQIVELANANIFAQGPRHPYAQALWQAVPRFADVVKDAGQDAGQDASKTLSGHVPSQSRPLTGCGFFNRCPMATDQCRSRQPALRPVAAGHQVACHLV